jgi:hypothetical protein
MRGSQGGGGEVGRRGQDVGANGVFRSGWDGQIHPRAKSGLGTDKSIPDSDIPRFRHKEISATGPS